MENWLQNRLSPVKIDTDRWSELGAAIEQYWEENFDPDLAWVVSLRSIYEADLDGQLLIQAAKGAYFEDNIPTTNIPLAVQQKELELCQKGSCYPFENTLKRLGLDAEWIALYASRVNEYGSDFVHAGHVPVGYRLDGAWTVSNDGDAVLRAGYFLTSRGVLKVELSDESLAEEIALIRNRLTQTRPVWIVFDGIIYRIGTEIIQDHELETTGHIKAESKLSGWNCGLKLDGTWTLGRVIRLDGSWNLNRGWNVGQIWPRGVIVNKLDGRDLDGSWKLSMSLLPHYKILDCRLETGGAIRAESEVTAWRTPGNYFHVTDESPVPLDGDYQLGVAYERWPHVVTADWSSNERPVYFGGSASELPVDVVYYGLPPLSIYSGGSAGVLPSDEVLGGDADNFPTDIMLGGNEEILSDHIIYCPLFRLIYLGGSTELFPSDIIWGGDMSMLPETIIYYGSLPWTFYSGGSAILLPRDIIWGGDMSMLPETIIG